jgi:hypothetical protein
MQKEFFLSSIRENGCKWSNIQFRMQSEASWLSSILQRSILTHYCPSVQFIFFFSGVVATGISSQLSAGKKKLNRRRVRVDIFALPLHLGVPSNGARKRARTGAKCLPKERRSRSTSDQYFSCLALSWVYPCALYVEWSEIIQAPHHHHQRKVKAPLPFCHFIRNLLRIILNYFLRLLIT